MQDQKRWIKEEMGRGSRDIWLEDNKKTHIRKIHLSGSHQEFWIEKALGFPGVTHLDFCDLL